MFAIAYGDRKKYRNVPLLPCCLTSARRSGVWSMAMDDGEAWSRRPSLPRLSDDGRRRPISPRAIHRRTGNDCGLPIPPVSPAVGAAVRPSVCLSVHLTLLKGDNPGRPYQVPSSIASDVNRLTQLLRAGGPSRHMCSKYSKEASTSVIRCWKSPTVLIPLGDWQF